MEDGGNSKRERKPIVKRLPALDDELEFRQNKSSNNARPLCEVAVSLATHLWIDKHYHNRYNFGDQFGKREGIEPNFVESLVKRAIPHLLFYSTSVKGFYFINGNVTSDKPVRVVLMEGDGDDKLNVVIESHFTEMNKFEITVKTALREEFFRLSHGQYAIEIQGDSSVLYRKDNNSIIEVFNV